jgi:glucose uptake protein GlcU
MNVAAILFAIAALGGIIMAMIRLSGRDYPPAFLAVVHGLFAAAGLVALLMAVFAPGVATSFKIALVLFVVAALGGFWLVSYHFKRQALPIPLMVIHALVAVVAFIILLVGIMSQP